jgi:hypothetical protein
VQIKTRLNKRLSSALCVQTGEKIRSKLNPMPGISVGG